MKKILLPIILLLIILSGCKKIPTSEIEVVDTTITQEMQTSEENYQPSITSATLGKPTLSEHIQELYDTLDTQKLPTERNNISWIPNLNQFIVDDDISFMLAETILKYIDITGKNILEDFDDITKIGNNQTFQLTALHQDDVVQ